MRALGLGLLAMLWLAGAVPVAAQADARSCIGIADDTARLACFDAAFANGAASSDGLSFALKSEQLIPARPSGREPAEMVVACTDGVLSVQFRFAGQLVSSTGDFAAITFQSDLQPARSRTLNASPDNTALGFWTTGEAAAFLDSLSGSQNLSVRITPVNQRSLSIRFRLAPLDEALPPIRSACD